MSVIQGTGHSTRIIFADSSIKNSIEGSKSYSYSVDGNGVGTQLKTEDIKATTTPSNARAVGQTKITVRYVDTEGKEIETQDYKYGYPAGLATTPKSPNYDVKPKNINNYTLVTEPTTVPGVAGTQLTTNKSIEFKGDDQNVYYVYKLKEGTAKVKYIDDTTNEVLEVKDDLKGKYNTKSTYTIDDTVKKYTDKNYEFVSSTYPTDGVTFGKEEQVFEVHLKHKTEKAPESKKVKQTINYVYKDNNPAEPAFPTVERELEFTRENTKDLVTNVVTNGQWTATNGTVFTEVVSPTKPGYTADKAKVEAVNNVTEDTADIVETVVYSPETQKLTYTVIDDTTNTTLEDKKDLASGDSNSEVKPETQTTYDQIVAGYEAKGYEVVTKEALPEKFDTDITVDQNVTIHLKHKTEAIKEEKKVSLTVRYHGAGDKTPPNHVEEAVWTRTVTKDKVTGEIIDNGTWVSDKSKYAEVTSPVIEGYTADILVVAAETVTQDNIVKDVNYTAKPQEPKDPKTPINPDPKTPNKDDKKKILPSTGLNNTNNLTVLGLLSIIATFGIRNIKKKH